MSYIVPIHRPSGVRHAIKLNFLSHTEDSLVVAKANRLEVYEQSQDGYILVHTRSVYGYITMLERLRPASSQTDHLFVGTDRYQYFTCSWDAATRQIKTEQSYVDQADKVLRDSRDMDRCHIDPTRRFMTLELYDGVVTVIPIEQPPNPNKRVKRESSASRVGTLAEPVQVRIEELVTRSSAFAQTEPDDKSNPRLAILWEDNQEIPQLKIRELKCHLGDSPSADLETVAELRKELDMGVSHLIPISAPYGGFLLLGERSISYTDNGLKKMITRDLKDVATIWACWTKVDDRRFLLADDYGKLFFLMIETNDIGVTGWQLDSVGSASRASCLVYLDEGFVYVGSHSGDSQIVEIVPGGVSVVQSFPNIAPILDLSIMDLGRGAEGGPTSDFSSGQARIVTASGAWQDGSIRSVRSGVGMEELGTIAELSHITEIWSLSSTGASDVQDTLVVTFVNETKVLRLNADESLEELEDFAHFELSQPTLFAADLPDRRALQVSEGGLRIADVESRMLLMEWKPPDAAAKITAAAANSVHLLVVEGGHTLHVFHPANNDPKPTMSKTFPSTSQISSVTVPDQSNVCIVSFWQTASVAILDLHSLELLYQQALGTPGGATPRSVLVANVLPDAPPTLFIAMADGTVVTFAFDPSRNLLTGMTKILLGTEPVFFKVLPRDSDSHSGLSNVFASCEQPSLIYSSEGRIIFSAVNSDKASRVCHFNSAAYPGAIAIATPTELKLAMIGRERATQLQTLPLGQTVRCLAYDSNAKMFGMGCIRRLIEGNTEALLSSFQIADEVGFKKLDSRELNDQELVECVISTGEFETDDEVYDGMFVVGTSIAVNDGLEDDHIRGRILVFELNKEKKIRLVTETSVKGSCRSLAMCEGKIVAGLVKTVVLYGLVPSTTRGRQTLELSKLASYRTSTNPLSLAVTPSTTETRATIAVADLMKSLSIVEVHAPSSSNVLWGLKEVSRHFATVWSSATAVTGENEWVVADMEGNLAIMKRDPEGVTADDKKKLQVTGEFRLGEVVNKIIPIFPPGSSAGSAKGKERARTLSSAARPMDVEMDGVRSGPIVAPKAFLATVEGAIYMLGSINTSHTDAMLRLQTSLASKVQAPGYMPWTKFRAWKTEVRESEEPFRFVDGEMVEQGLLKLSGADLEAVLREAGLTEGKSRVTLEEARAWGEELRRLY